MFLRIRENPQCKGVIAMALIAWRSCYILSHCCGAWNVNHRALQGVPFSLSCGYSVHWSCVSQNVTYLEELHRGIVFFLCHKLNYILISCFKNLKKSRLCFRHITLNLVWSPICEVHSSNVSALRLDISLHRVGLDCEALGMRYSWKGASFVTRLCCRTLCRHLQI